MRTKLKALTLALCAVLLVVSTVFVTMAFLTDEDRVVNTFTVGQVKIKLDEAKVNPDGTIVSGAERVQNNKYHLIPGHKYVKDPVVYIDAESENCWLFVKLENGLKEIIAATTIEEQIQANGWSVIDEANNIWAYKEIVGAGMKVPTFAEFTLKTDADVSAYDTEENPAAKIEVTAYAVQADGFATAAAAWEATSADFFG